MSVAGAGGRGGGGGGVAYLAPLGSRLILRLATYPRRKRGGSGLLSDQHVEGALADARPLHRVAPGLGGIRCRHRAGRLVRVTHEVPQVALVRRDGRPPHQLRARFSRYLLLLLPLRLALARLPALVAHQRHGAASPAAVAGPRGAPAPGQPCPRLTQPGLATPVPQPAAHAKVREAEPSALLSPCHHFRVQPPAAPRAPERLLERPYPSRVSTARGWG